MFSENMKKQMLDELEEIDIVVKFWMEICQNMDIFGNEPYRLKRCLNELMGTIKSNNTDSIDRMPNRVHEEMLEELKKLNVSIRISDETKQAMIHMVQSNEMNKVFLENQYKNLRIIRLYLNETLMAVDPDKSFELEKYFSKENLKEMIVPKNISGDYKQTQGGLLC